MMKIFSVLAIVLLLTACMGRYREISTARNHTLEMVNTGSLVYKVVLSPSVMVSLYPGQKKCVWIGVLNKTQTIEVFAFAGSVVYSTPPENLAMYPGWLLELEDRPKYDVLSLRPSSSCKTV